MQSLEKIQLKSVYFYGEKIQVHCSSLKSLEIFETKFEASNNIFFKNILAKFIKGFPNLEELILDNRLITYSRLANISMNAKNVRKLEIHLIGNYTCFTDARFPKLLKIKICKNFCKPRFVQFNDLLENSEVQEIELDRIVNEEDFQTILKNAKKLKVLRLNDGTGLPGDILERNESLLKNLQILRINNFVRQTETSRQFLATHPTLRSFISSD